MGVSFFSDNDSDDFCRFDRVFYGLFDILGGDSWLQNFAQPLKPWPTRNYDSQLHEETRLATTRACNAYQKFERTPPLTWLSRPSSRPSSGQCLCLFCLSVRFPSQAKLSDCCVPSESCGEDKRECIAILILCMKRSIWSFCIIQYHDVHHLVHHLETKLSLCAGSSAGSSRSGKLSLRSQSRFYQSWMHFSSCLPQFVSVRTSIPWNWNWTWSLSVVSMTTHHFALLWNAKWPVNSRS